MLTNKSFYTLLAGLPNLNVCSAVHNIPSPNCIYFNCHNMQKDSVCMTVHHSGTIFGSLQIWHLAVHNPESCIQCVFWQLPFKQIHKIPQWSVVTPNSHVNHVPKPLPMQFAVEFQSQQPSYRRIQLPLSIIHRIGAK